MTARYASGRRITRRHAARWIAGIVGLGVAAAGIVLMAPSSGAATSVNAQLSLSGVATASNILGGTTIGIHPGDTVDFHASALPTAGLDSIPSLGPVLDDVLHLLLGQYQVVATFGPSFPGGARTVTIGGPTTGVCKGAPDVPVNFPSVGTYSFTWKVQYVLPIALGCSANGIGGANLNLLKGAGVAINASNQWTGQIVVADNPPPGGISIQLPGLTVAPSIPVVGQLPTIGLSQINLPTIPVDIPSILSSLPIPHPSSSAPGGDSTSPVGGTYTPPPVTVPEQVVPGAGGNVGDGFGVQPDTGGLHQIGSGLTSNVQPEVPLPSFNPAPAPPSRQPELAANKAPAAQLPVLLAIIAIIALSLVTATYARLYLLRRDVAA